MSKFGGELCLGGLTDGGKQRGDFVKGGRGVIVDGQTRFKVKDWLGVPKRFWTSVCVDIREITVLIYLDLSILFG